MILNFWNNDLNPASRQNIHTDRILILDFGSQYTQLIARRVREAGVYCELVSWDIPQGEIREFQPKGIILSGGPETVTESLTARAPDIVFQLQVPVLGICYGMQTMAAQLGGEVESSAHREFGYAQVRARGHSILLRDIEDHTTPEGYGMLDEKGLEMLVSFAHDYKRITQANADQLSMFTQVFGWTPPSGWIVRGDKMSVCSMANLVCLIDDSEASLNEVLNELKDLSHY